MTALATLGITVLDCPDPAVLARFYGAVLGWESDPGHTDDDWAQLRPPGGGPTLAFQRAPDHRPPAWPGPGLQAHLDLDVPDIDAAEPDLLALGARRHEVQPSANDSFRVYLDPAGHPFCLVRIP